jgi:hypothetical protein
MGAKACQGASLSSPPELVREQKCYEYFPHRLAADPYWLVFPAPLTSAVATGDHTVVCSPGGLTSCLLLLLHNRKEIMPSYRRLNPDELPAEYADGTDIGDHINITETHISLYFQSYIFICFL